MTKSLGSHPESTDWYMASTKALSISLPVNPSVAVASRSVNLNSPDRCPFRLVGQIDEPKLIPSTLAQEFRRKLRDIISSRHDKYGGRFLLHPGEKRTKDPGRCASVRAARAFAPAECFIQLVDPEAAGRNRLRGLDDGSLHPLSGSGLLTMNRTGLSGLSVACPGRVRACPPGELGATVRPRISPLRTKDLALIGAKIGPRLNLYAQRADVTKPGGNSC